jgi:hypothetical protein
MEGTYGTNREERVERERRHGRYIMLHYLTSSLHAKI